MKQHTTPLIIKDETVEKLERVSLNAKDYDENWVQKICFENPSILPFEEIEPSFGGMISICRELTVDSGSIDLVYVNELGFITIGECKLWRNPEARRKVIGQVLDYAKDLSKWDYSKFEKECLKSRNNAENSLYDILQQGNPDVDEALFIDNIQKNLKRGRFLLAIIGDGIRENMEELAAYIHQNANLNFTICLIELPIYQSSTNEIIVTPRVLAKTLEIEKVVYRISDTPQEEKSVEDSTSDRGKSLSEQVFFEKLSASIGEEKTRQAQSFINLLIDELNIITTLGRGKRLSLNLKSPNGLYNFASLQEDGEIWFYGIVTKTEEIGDKQIGIGYLTALADAVGGKLDDSYKQWNWCVKKNGKYINITEYLEVKDQWLKIISDALDKISMLEENN
jgi:hypothetical protein